MNLFFFLLVALLRACCSYALRCALTLRADAPPAVVLQHTVKVNLDGSGDSNFFEFIVATMSIVPVGLPILIRIYMQFFGSLEMRMLVEDNTFA
jgi:hypothetical protein